MSDGSAAGTASGARPCWPPCRATLGDAVTVVGADAGLHVVAWLNGVPRAREAALIARAHAAGLGLYADHAAVSIRPRRRAGRTARAS